MNSHEDEVGIFVSRAGWSGADRTPIAGDLSARRYSRLVNGEGRTAILMEAGPHEFASTSAFVSIAEWLRNVGLSAPSIFAQEMKKGLLLLEDFGDDKVSIRISKNAEFLTEFIHKACEALLVIRSETAPSLPKPTADDLVSATTLVDDWYPDADTAALDDCRLVLAPLIDELLTETRTVSLRDFHSDNTIWLPARKGPAQLGLLDFQDAFVVHPAYDLMSMLTDARTDIPSHMIDQGIEIYAAQSGDDLSRLRQAVAVLGFQRNLRILGIFARAARRDGKRQHLPAIPRVFRYLDWCVSHEGLSELRVPFQSALPRTLRASEFGLRHE